MVLLVVVVVGLGFRELVSDRRGSLSDKWRDSPWPEGAAGPARLPRTLVSLSAMEAGIIIAL